MRRIGGALENEFISNLTLIAGSRPQGYCCIGKLVLESNDIGIIADAATLEIDLKVKKVTKKNQCWS